MTGLAVFMAVAGWFVAGFATLQWWTWKQRRLSAEDLLERQHLRYYALNKNRSTRGSVTASLEWLDEVRPMYVTRAEFLEELLRKVREDEEGTKTGFRPGPAA